ncbi:MAG: glycosyltransferase [Acidimicrobiales bacterium]
MTTRSHAVLVTFRRPELLTRHLEQLAAQTAPLATLVVVDNDGDDAIRRLVVDRSPMPATEVVYLPRPGNPGPAGGFTAGLATLLPLVDDDDIVVLLDDNDPPRHTDTFAELRRVYLDLLDAHDDFGGVGTWGASLGTRGRLRTETACWPRTVDYLSGNGCPHYRAGALRAVGGPDPDLFFGFEELDLGLSLQRAGFRIWSSGLARDLGLADMVEPTRARLSVDRPNWRRYYSFHNLIVVLRKDGRQGDAVWVTVVPGLAKPLANLLLHPHTAALNLRLNGTALVHGWRRHLGKHLDPGALPAHLR